MNYDDMTFVILDDSDYSAVVEREDRTVLMRVKGMRWKVSARHGVNGHVYTSEVLAATSVEARNAFVAEMGQERKLACQWSAWKVGKA